MVGLIPLTKREQDVLHLIAYGLSNKEVAQRLDISSNTVRAHIRLLVLKSGLNNKTQLILKYHNIEPIK